MTDHSITDLKFELRRNMRLLRRQVSPQQRSDWDQDINRALLDHTQKINVSSVAAFWPFDGEPDLTFALNTLATRGVTVALPVREAGAKARMDMHRWRPQSIMRENRLHILEPVDEQRLDPADIEILVIPLVAWDNQGNRLGMGAGFYDRFLAPLRTSAAPMRVGAAYGLQEVAKVPANDRDIPLHALLCEQGWTAFGQ